MVRLKEQEGSDVRPSDVPDGRKVSYKSKPLNPTRVGIWAHGSWHEHIGDPTVADAILDRVLHNAYKIELTGPSRRKEKTTKAS